jgi:small subunit ribosomal protein S20
MANHKSAEKRIRQNEKRRAINRANRGRMRTEIKKLRSALALGDLPAAQELLPGVVSIIDKSIQKGVLHRNAAARYKSRLTTSVIGLQTLKQA